MISQYLTFTTSQYLPRRLRYFSVLLHLIILHGLLTIEMLFDDQLQAHASNYIVIIVIQRRKLHVCYWLLCKDWVTLQLF